MSAIRPRLSELVKRAQKQPQPLTSHGERVAVVLSSASNHRQQHEGESLVAFIRRSPLAEPTSVLCIVRPKAAAAPFMKTRCHQ